MLIPAAAAALAGVRWGLQFNPLAVMVATPAAAALVGYPKAPRSHWAWSALLLAGAWALGDGLSLAISLGGAHDGATARWAAAAMVAVSLGIGFVLPALAGAYVGRRVIRGTGWLSAIAVAAMVAGALLAAAPVLARAVPAGVGG